MSAALGTGRLTPRQRRRIMSYPLVIRLMIAMALMPDVLYCEALSRLAGLLADIPFTREWHVPTEKVITDWRLPVPPDLMQSLFWRAAGPLAGDGEASAVMLAGMPVAAADGMPATLGTRRDRASFGTTGIRTGPPVPQLRLARRSPGPGARRSGQSWPGGTGQQTRRTPGPARPEPSPASSLLRPHLPGHDLITAILDAGGHVAARVKAGIALPFEDGPGCGWLPDGSRMTWLNARSERKAERLPVRAAEHNAVFPAGDGDEQVSETCTIITTLLDHQAAPAEAVRDAYLTRWSAAETTFGEDKAMIAGAGNRTSGPVLRSDAPGWSSRKPGPG